MTTIYQSNLYIKIIQINCRHCRAFFKKAAKCKKLAPKVNIRNNNKKAEHIKLSSFQSQYILHTILGYTHSRIFPSIKTRNHRVNYS